jgi:hypothetical protein
MKKGLLIGCGIAGILGVVLCAGVVALFVSGISGIFRLTQPIVDASNDFLGLVGQGKIVEAYSSTADGFRAQQDEYSFTSAVKQLGLTEYSSASWQNRQFTNNEGSAEGTVTTKGGSTKAVAIRLVYEMGKWKVVGVRYGGVELATIKALPPVPAEKELERITLESLVAFNEAVQAKDFTAFHATLSDALKKEKTPEGLQKEFHEFIDNKIDINPIKDHKPEFAPPVAVNDKGALLVTGQYPTQPLRVRFELKYNYERGDWRLIGISLTVGK